jgi:hypothetical protein
LTTAEEKRRDDAAQRRYPPPAGPFAGSQHGRNRIVNRQATQIADGHACIHRSAASRRSARRRLRTRAAPFGYELLTLSL